MKAITTNYLPIYGHQASVSRPPKLRLHLPLTEAEIEFYFRRTHQCLNGSLLLEPSPDIYNELPLPHKDLLIESQFILRPPLAYLGHHNQVTAEFIPPQNTVTITNTLFIPSQKRWVPSIHPYRKFPVSDLLTTCRDWQIPLEAALRFLVWENRRRGGTLPFSLSDLERELSIYLDMEEWLRRLTSE